MTVSNAAQAYGGTESSCALVPTWPIPRRIVGKKREKAYKGMRQPIRSSLAIHDETALNTDALILGEETRSVGPVKDHPPTKGANNDRSKTFEDKDPSPTRSAANSIHLRNSSGEETTEGTGQSGGGEEDGGAGTDLGTLVPASEIVIDTRVKTGFCDTEEETRC
ncbi:hypothetical protein HG530_006778 [Fusarium avenaceum]|nr:hypothetical protein HG530_006778 [Fusarium avenaceum]